MAPDNTAKLKLFFLVLVLWLGLGDQPGRAQSVGGTIRGRVRDASGGVISGAQFTVRDMDKGILHETRSDALGLYQITLPMGTYQMEAAAGGFVPVKQTGIFLSLGQTLAIDLTLEVSGAQEIIEVRAEPPLVDTASGTISGLIDRERLAELPLNGRDFGQLALLHPGVVLNNN